MKVIEKISAKVERLAIEHPVASLVVSCVAGLAVTMPLCVASYKYAGKIQGKAMAKELAKAGVSLGYTHD